MLLSLARYCLLVYIRRKIVKGITYAYLVKSEWDKRRGSSIQHTIRYLGRADGIAISDIPEEYRNDPKILSFLSLHAFKDQTRKELFLKKQRAQLFKALCDADREKATEVALDYLKLFSLKEFYEDLLTPVMYRIGDLWAEGRLSVVTEHLCSNIACSLIHALNPQSKPRTHKATILICSPEGELHHLAADMFESVLLQKGYEVYNAAPSAPADSIVSMIPRFHPHLIMISITLEDHLRPALRLVRRIRLESKLPILLGGLATRQLKDQEKQKIEKSYRVSFMSEESIDKIIRSVKTLTSM